MEQCGPGFQVPTLRFHHNNILDLSRIEARKMSLVQSDFRREAIFDQIKYLLKDNLRHKGLTLVIEPAEVPQWLRGDSLRLWCN